MKALILSLMLALGTSSVLGAEKHFGKIVRIKTHVNGYIAYRIEEYVKDGFKGWVTFCSDNMPDIVQNNVSQVADYRKAHSEKLGLEVKVTPVTMHERLREFFGDGTDLYCIVSTEMFRI